MSDDNIDYRVIYHRLVRAIVTNPELSVSALTQGLGFPTQPSQDQAAQTPGLHFAFPDQTGQLPPPPAAHYQSQVQPTCNTGRTFAWGGGRFPTPPDQQYQPRDQPTYFSGTAFPQADYSQPPPPTPSFLPAPPCPPQARQYRPQVQPEQFLDLNFQPQGPPVNCQAGFVPAVPAQPVYTSGLACHGQPHQAQPFLGPYATLPCQPMQAQPHAGSCAIDENDPTQEPALRRMARQLQRFYESPKTLGNKELVSEDDIRLAKSIDPCTSTPDGFRWPAHWMTPEGRKRFIEELEEFRIFGSGLTVPLVDPELGQGPAPVAPADHPHNDMGVAANAIIVPDDEEVANDMLAYGQDLASDMPANGEEMPDLPAEALDDEDDMPAETYVDGVDDDMPVEDEEMADVMPADDSVGGDNNFIPDPAAGIFDRADQHLSDVLSKVLGRD
ncbi:hypothetical protein HYE67_001265 [Fusarium culmorum]|uniref:Uncharacterized protein n=1 Tax=Fusarium culmorum TaxID=5516 RepID=A0A2T4GV42_FUSCU|nr:hypothetical protein FCULG_00005393 [Fusarium culmorum]QPC59034.1 hypothetical protein HYE67_001265 [Fusarium culmorum]